MPLHQKLPQFIDNLISLRDHYQALLSEYEQKTTHVREQLSHVNALLLAQLAENQQVVQSLIELRSHYQALHEQQQQKATHAREQITHLNALLADQLVWQNQQSVSIAAATLEEKQPLFGVPDAKNEDLPKPPSETTAETSIPEGSEQNVAPKFHEQEQLTESEESEPSDIDLDSNGQTKLSSLTKTPMLPEYQNLTKVQAVEKLLQDNQGSILHVDYIIRALYGDLDAEAIKAEKPRMYDTLSQGTDKGLWDKVPEQASCYTIDLKLVEPEEAEHVLPVNAKKTNSQNMVGSRRRQSLRGKPSDEILPPYQRMSLTAAVENVVQEHPGEILTTEKVAKALYGDIEGRALTKAKDRIGKILWGGATQKRWQRVPGRLGCYTLDLNKVISK
jgi:hypothetical protein